MSTIIKIILALMYLSIGVTMSAIMEAERCDGKCNNLFLGLIYTLFWPIVLLIEMIKKWKLDRK